MAIVLAEQTDNHLQNVLQQLNAAIVTGQTLPSLLGSVKMALQKIESEQEEIERVAKSNGNLDPETAEEIRELKRKLRSCTSCAKEFLNECVFAAEYGLDKEIEKEIKEELEQGKLNTLQSFLIHFVKRLEQSKQQLEDFNSSQAEANKIAKEMTRRYKDKLDKTTSDTNAAMDQHETATLLGNVATGTKLVSGIALVGGIMMTSWQPKEALFMAIVSGAVVCGSYVFEHVAAARDLAAMNVLTGSTTHQFKSENALQSIGELQTSMSRIMKIIDDMPTHVDNTRRKLNKEEALGVHSDPGNRAEEQDISQRLETLHKSLREIQKVLEENEQSISENTVIYDPFSSKPGLV